MAAGLRPNSKAVERLTLRLKGRPGVVRAAKAPGGKGVTFITRAVRAVEALVEGATVFHETGMIYLRARVGIVGPGIGLQLSAVSFCAHALERLVERSDIDLQAALLPQVDAEAQAIFRGWDRAARIEEAGDEYYPAATPGLWAGGHDEMALEPDWGLCATDPCRSFPPAPSCPRPSFARPSGCAGKMTLSAGWHEARG